MTEYEFIEVSYRKYRTDNPEGTGNRLNMEAKSAKALNTDTSSEAGNLRQLYRLVKTTINQK